MRSFSRFPIICIFVVLSVYSFSCASLKERKERTLNWHEQLDKLKLSPANYKAYGKFDFVGDAVSGGGDIYLGVDNQDFRMELYVAGRLFLAFSLYQNKLYLIDGETGEKTVYPKSDYILLNLDRKLAIPLYLIDSLVRGAAPPIVRIGKAGKVDADYCLDESFRKFSICYAERLKSINIIDQDKRIKIELEGIAKGDIEYVRKVKFQYHPENLLMTINWRSVKKVGRFDKGYFTFDEEIDF